MNQFRISIAAGAAVAALAFGAAATAHPEHEMTKQEVREITIVKGDGKTASKTELAAKCGKGRRFESSASTGDDENKNVSKIVICSDPGESNEDWAKMLRDTLTRVEANSDMSAESKAKIVADLRSEIARNQ